MQQMLGRRARAERAYRRAISLQEPLANRSPNVAGYKYELANSLYSLGCLLLAAGQPHPAAKVLSRCVRLRGGLRDRFAGGPSHELLELLRHSGLPRHPEDASPRSWADRQTALRECWKKLPYDLAASHSSLCAALLLSGRLREADRACRKALRLLEKLVADDTAKPHYRELLAKTHANHAELLGRAGRLPEAEKACGRALALFQKLAAEHPDVPAYREGLAKSHSFLGKVLSESRRPAEAEKALGQALALWQKLSNDFPFWLDYRLDLSITQNDLGIVLQFTGRPAQAEKAFRQAQALMKGLVKVNPDLPQNLRQLARASYNLGGLLDATGRPVAAEAPLRQAQALYEKLLAGSRPNALRGPAQGANEDHPGFRPELAATLNALALVLLATGRAPQAQQAYRQAVAHWQKVADEFPKEPTYQSNLAGTLANLARLYNARGEWAKARPVAEEAIRRQQIALRQSQGHPVYGRALPDHFLALADALLGLGKTEDAARAAEELVRAFPKGAREACLAADVLARCVPLAAKDDRLSPTERQARARAYTERIQTLVRKVDRQGTDDPAARKAQARFLALCPHRGVGDPDRAVALAKEALERSPRDGSSWTTLGVALYRAGKWQKAVTALEFAVRYHPRGNGLDGFFLAMSHWRLGARDQAGQWYRRTATWMDRHEPDSSELRRVRAEAAALMGRDLAAP
jgi:tetratricopeptide (TPR) repeat protein